MQVNTFSLRQIAILCYTIQMSLGAQLPVRLESEVDERLQIVAKQAGTSKSSLIRLLAKTFTDHVCSRGGKIVLPPDWKELLKPADGRSLEMRDKPNSKTGSAVEAAYYAGAGKKISYRRPRRVKKSSAPPNPAPNEQPEP